MLSCYKITMITAILAALKAGLSSVISRFIAEIVLGIFVVVWKLIMRRRHEAAAVSKARREFQSAIEQRVHERDIGRRRLSFAGDSKRARREALSRDEFALQEIISKKVVARELIERYRRNRRPRTAAIWKSGLWFVISDLACALMLIVGFAATIAAPIAVVVASGYAFLRASVAARPATRAGNEVGPLWTARGLSADVRTPMDGPPFFILVSYFMWLSLVLLPAIKEFRRELTAPPTTRLAALSAVAETNKPAAGVDADRAPRATVRA
jgi:hypothetical protein